MAGPRADKVTARRRTEAVYRLILKGYDSEEIFQNTSSWGVTKRQIHNYINAAERRIQEAAAPERERMLAEAFARLRLMRREATTIKEQLDVLREEAALGGIYPDKTVVVRSWQDEVVELLRNGGVEPEDVRAAYPELAPEFFAKAGIEVSE